MVAKLKSGALPGPTAQRPSPAGGGTKFTHFGLVALTA
jgi:hypothetical protein